MRYWIDLLEKALSSSTLKEGVEIAELGHRDVKVVRNPSRQQMVQLFSDYHELRGIIDREQDFYVWDAWAAVHNQINDALGISYVDLLVMKNGVVARADEETLENPNFLRAFGGVPKVLDI